MRADLPVDKLEPAPGIGDLLAEAGGKLSKEIAMFARSSFGVEVQLRNFTGKQHVPFGIKVAMSRTAC
jgi:hypothetical protein